jgi:predicted Zn-dependent peptidase
MFGLSFDPNVMLMPNGLRVITVARPKTPTVAVRVYVRAGSRYDVEHEVAGSPQGALGLAHLTEHLLFKGTTRRSQREIFGSVERLGGALDGGTTKEYAALSVVVARQGLPTALNVLGELIAEPALREEDLWSEKLVVSEEIRLAQDQQAVIHGLFAKTLWRQHPFRHPVQGSSQAMGSVDLDTLLAFHRQRYVAGNMVLSVCGDTTPERVGGLVGDAFDGLRAGSEQPPTFVRERPPSQPRRAHLTKDIAQTHVLIGVPTVDMSDEDRGPLKVIERVLGMGGSARLYQRLREELGLAYSVRTVSAHYEDAGCLAVHVACDPSNVSSVERAVRQVWEALCQEGASADELSAAKGNYAGTLARRFETNRALAGIFGVEGLLHCLEPFDEALRRIDAVTRGDVVRVARTYLIPRHTVTVTVGRC